MRISVFNKTKAIVILLLAGLLIIFPANMGIASSPPIDTGSTPEPVKQYQQDTVLTETPTPISIDYSEQELEKEQPIGIIIGAGILVVIIFAGTLLTLSRYRPGNK